MSPLSLQNSKRNPKEKVETVVSPPSLRNNIKEKVETVVSPLSLQNSKRSLKVRENVDAVLRNYQIITTNQNFLLECIRRVKKGKQKEIRPEDLLIDLIIKKQVSRSCQINQPVANRATTKNMKNMVLQGHLVSPIMKRLLRLLQLMTMRTMNY